MKRIVVFLLTFIVITITIPLSENLAETVEMPNIPTDNALILPLPSKLVHGNIYHESGNAMSWSRNEIYYIGASREDVEYFLGLCSVCGTYPCPLKSDVDAEFYALVSINDDSHAEFYYLPERSMIWLRYDADAITLDDAQIDHRLAELPAHASLPERTEDYVFPQLSSCSGKQCQYNGKDSGISFIYDGGEFQYEWYEEIETRDIVQYTALMRLLGMHVYADMTVFNDEGFLQMITLHYTDGATDVIVQFDASLHRSVVYYEPELNYYLLDEIEYKEAFVK